MSEGAARRPAPLYGEAELHAGTIELGRQISSDHPDGLVMVSLLKGSLLFFADLVRSMTVPVTIDFLAISTYQPESGRVRIVKDLDAAIDGRNVVLVEDIVDTGLAATFLLAELARREPASLALCTLFDKTARRIVPVPIAYRGFEVPDRFILGYGLDFAGRYRNLPAVYAGDLDVLRSDPDAYVAVLYGEGQPDSR